MFGFESVVFGVMLHSAHLESIKFESEGATQAVVEYSKNRPHRPKISFGEEFKYNDSTPGLYAIADGWTAAVFRNSYRKPSVFGGYTLAKQTRFGEFAATLGVSTGYEYRTYTWARDNVKYSYRGGFGGKLVPVGMLSYATPPIPGTTVKARLMYTPRKEVLTLGVEAKF